MWTPTGQPLDNGPWRGSGWRAVEAQHENATLALAQGRLADQALLEDIVDTAKPALPAAAHGLHYLLATPFRYRSPPPAGSRFRGRDDPGVFYGAEAERTACAEAGYWRLRFWLDSAGLRDRPTGIAMTLFRFHAATERAIDLTQLPLLAQRAEWTAPADYAPTQALARVARQQEAELIRYESVRDPQAGACLALLSPAPFQAVRRPYRHEQQGWNLYLQPPDLTVWQRNLDGPGFEFHYP